MGLITASCGQMQGSLTQAVGVASSREANAADAYKSHGPSLDYAARRIR